MRYATLTRSILLCDELVEQFALAFTRTLQRDFYGLYRYLLGAANERGSERTRSSCRIYYMNWRDRCCSASFRWTEGSLNPLDRSKDAAWVLQFCTACDRFRRSCGWVLHGLESSFRFILISIKSQSFALLVVVMGLLIHYLRLYNRSMGCLFSLLVIVFMLSERNQRKNAKA